MLELSQATILWTSLAGALLITLTIRARCHTVIERHIETPKEKKALGIARRVRTGKKEQNKEAVLNLLKRKKRVTNNDVERLLSVSDRTATRYLAELEGKGSIKREGKKGRSVYYVQK